MSDRLSIRTMAFAGICEAAFLVQRVARHGSCDEEAIRHMLGSILNTDPKTPEEVLAGHPMLDGYKAIVEQLGNGTAQKNAELTRYVVSLIALERKLSRRQDTLNLLGERISQVKRQLHHFDLLDDQVLSNLAGIYSDHISPIGPRIQIAGNPVYLQQPLVQHKVRALLLAGLRSVVLWRQVGGQRRQILFGRKKMVQAAQAAIRHI